MTRPIHETAIDTEWGPICTLQPLKILQPCKIATNAKTSAVINAYGILLFFHVRLTWRRAFVAGVARFALGKLRRCLHVWRCKSDDCARQQEHGHSADNHAGN